MSGSHKQGLRRSIATGIAWNTGYQVLQAILSFAAMLVLVRIILPSEFGKAGAVVGWLTLVNAVSCRSFISHALQLPHDQEPNWSLHLSAGLYIQLIAIAVCELIALGLWMSPLYRPVALLLQVGAIGLIVELPNHLGGTMLRRNLDFRRLRIVQASGTFASLVTSVALGYAGTGAFAIVVGSNVVTGLPFAVDLFFVRGWRPDPRWWRFPGLRAYRAALNFGAQQSAGALLASGRGFLEAAFLPGLLGFEALGLLGRASALFGSSVSRVVTIASETVYPVLPSVARERARFEKYAGLYAQSTILIAVMGAIFFGALGPEVSRVLYGPRWAAADPLLWPAAVLSTGLSASLIGGNILLSQNRLKICLGLSIAACAVAVPGIVAAARGNVVTYAWFVATGEFFVGGVSVLLAGIELGRRWFRLVLTPVAVCAPAGLICLALTRPLLYVVPPAIALGLRALCYGLIIVAVLRVFCPELFNQMRNIVRPTAVSLPLQTSHVGAEESR